MANAISSEVSLPGTNSHRLLREISRRGDSEMRPRAMDKKKTPVRKPEDKYGSHDWRWKAPSKPLPDRADPPFIKLRFSVRFARQRDRRVSDLGRKMSLWHAKAVPLKGWFDSECHT